MNGILYVSFQQFAVETARVMLFFYPDYTGPYQWPSDSALKTGRTQKLVEVKTGARFNSLRAFRPSRT